MWTPRRVLLLFATLFGFGAAYAAYARFLGRIDGLPNLPSKYLDYDDGALPEVAPVESPTLVRLREAFGDNCPEMGAAYPTRLEIREQGIVFAAGMPQIGTVATKFVKLAPLSIATFAKPKPLHEQLPGEVAEVSSLHCDEGILEFDRPISSDRDMLTGKAKLIGIELRTNPDPHNTDPRNGRIVISNNQRTSDPSRFITMKTPGPVYYRTADHPEANNPSQPHIWTTAGVEIVNRDNLPRPLWGVALPVVSVPSDDSLTGSVVTDMALGLHTSPPTITADGLKIFMKRNENTKKSGYGGIREMILTENVLFSLWIDGTSGFPGAAPQAPTKPVKTENTLALSGLVGGIADGIATAARLKSKVLLRVRTLGTFRYDMATNLATFDVSSSPNPLLPNNVEVMRFLPAGGKDTLVCQKLEIEFNGPVTGQAKSEGTGFKRLHASGTHVLVAAATEQLQATGTALVYENDTGRSRTTTTLHGAPLSAVRNRNVLIAGAPTQPAKLMFVSSEKNKTDITIDGPGRAELFDEATREKTLTATWQKSLSQIREIADGVPLDLLVFTGDGEFIDAKGAFNLKGDVLKLWLRNGDRTANKSVPHRLQGLGHVSGLSANSIIENTEYLNVMFVDISKPPASAIPTTVAVIPPSSSAPVVQPVLRAQEIKKDPQPIRLSARLIDVTVHRINETDPKAAAKYDMHEAHCTDRVVVVQPPEDPKKSTIGIDIRGSSLLMKKQGLGHVMTVSGTNTEIARVRFEETTISGPMVTIDQPNNSVAVAGGGWMRLPSSSNLAGATVDEKGEITIHWQARMKFLGERRWAEFVGQVQAVQSIAEGAVAKGPTTTKSTVACHELNVTFDKPVYFNQMNRESGGGSDPKIKTVVCTPASEDGNVAKAANLVLYLEETIDRVTKKHTKATQVEAKLLEVNVDGDLSLVSATGPGVTRMLQLDAKDSAPGTPQPVDAKTEMEMKLTVVRFNGRLNLKDKKGIFQEAVFRETIRVARVPSENLNLVLDDTAKPPARSMFLKCNDTFTVSSYRAKTPGTEDTRTMEAIDGAEVKTDDYIGIGHSINYDGTRVILRGYGDGQATLYRRQNSIEGRDYKSGNPLIYNTKTGQVSGAQSSGGAFTTDK